MKKIVVLLVVLCALIPSVVSADELWVQNEGGLELSVWSESDWTEVTCSGFSAVGPSWTPEPGKAKVCAVTVPGPEWVIITAENIERWEIELHCNQKLVLTEPLVLFYPERESRTHWTFYVWDEMLRAFTPR